MDINTTVMQHGKILAKIRDEVMPTIRENNTAVGALQQQNQELVKQLQAALNLVQGAVDRIEALEATVAELQNNQATAVTAPVATSDLMDGWDLDEDEPDQQAPQQAPVQEAQQPVQQAPQQTTQPAGDEPYMLCNPDIALPDVTRMPKENRVRSNRADYFLAWMFKLDNPDAKQADIADWLGISRQSVSRYLNMTDAEELNQLPNYRHDAPDYMGTLQEPHQSAASQVQQTPVQQPVQQQAVQQAPVQQVQQGVAQVQQQQAAHTPEAMAVDPNQVAQEYPAETPVIENTLGNLINGL